MFKKYLFIFIVLFIISDLVFSFYQHLGINLDGDMSLIIIESDYYTEVLKHPFGLNLLFKPEYYPGPNRYFTYLIMQKYFTFAPKFFQYFTDPIHSVFISAAFAKIIIQAIILYLLSVMASGTFKFNDKYLIITALLITPLFQTNGNNSHMGIILNSITYTFFYSLQILFILIFFLPFYLQFYFNKKIKFNNLLVFLYCCYSVFLCLNGPLNPGIFLIIITLIFANKLYSLFSIFKENKFIFNKNIFENTNIDFRFIFILFILFILSVYSIFIGKFNSETVFSENIPILERYQKLFYGLYLQFTQKSGLFVLSVMLAINFIIIFKNKKNENFKKILNISFWIFAFTVLYLLLLPLGGYRSYRPFIVRGDTFLPILILMFYYFGISTLYILKNNYNQKYLLLIVFGLLFFMWKDRSFEQKNECEIASLKLISNSKSKIVKINNNCRIVSWANIIDYKKSFLNAKLIYHWGITKEPKLYFVNR